MSDPNSRRAGWRAHLLALAGYLLLTLAFTWPLAFNWTTAIPGDGFDGWQNYWNQWWLKLALVDRLSSPLFTDILYAPTGVGLYFHTLNPLNGLASLPVQINQGLIAAYNAVVLLSWVLGGYGMFLLARWVIGSASPSAGLAAFVAGMIYTFSPFHMAHLLGHMQVMSLQWLPFYILYLLRSTAVSLAGAGWTSRGETSQGLQANARVRQSLGRGGGEWVFSGLLAGLFLVANGLSDWYFVLYLFLFTALFLVWTWLGASLSCLREKGSLGAKVASSLRVLWATVRPSLLAGGVFAIVLSPWLLPMIAEARQFQFMVRPPADLYALSASLMDFLVLNRLHTLLRPDSFGWIGNQIAPISERTISIGYVALGLAAAAALLAPRKAAPWLLAALFFLMLAMGPQWRFGNITWEDIPPAVQAGEEIASWTPYGLLNEWVPFMRISRSVSRFALLVQLSVAVLAAIGLHRLFARRWGDVLPPAAQTAALHSARTVASTAAPPAMLALAGVLLAAIAFEYWVAPYPLSPPDTPAYYARLAADPDQRAVLNLPMNYDRPGYLLYQTVHGKPLTVAYISRDDPRTLTERVPVLQHFRHLGPDIIGGDPALTAPTIFADLGVGTVTLDRYKMPGGEERDYTEALAARIFAGQEPAFADARLTVYKVAIPATPAPYLELGQENWLPYEVGEDGSPRRALGSGPAAVTIRHAATPPTPGLLRVQIRYRTQGAGAGPALRVYAGGQLLAELPAAEAGSERLLDVPAGATGDVLLLLEPLRLETVYIEQLQLR